MNDLNDPVQYMKEALRLASEAEDRDEVPIGCVIVHDGVIIGSGSNRREELQQPSAHAEMEAIAQAAKVVGSWRLEDCDLYVTLEPCPMCAGAIIQSRIRKVYYGAYDPKGGSVDTCVRLFEVPQYNHHPQWEGGLLEEECAGLLKAFFKKKRKKKKDLPCPQTVSEKQAASSQTPQAEASEASEQGENLQKEEKIESEQEI